MTVLIVVLMLKTDNYCSYEGKPTLTLLSHLLLNVAIMWTLTMQCIQPHIGMHITDCCHLAWDSCHSQLSMQTDLTNGVCLLVFLKRSKYTQHRKSRPVPSALKHIDSDSLHCILFYYLCVSWWHGSVVRTSVLAGELSLPCARPAADGWPLMWVATGQPTRPTQPFTPSGSMNE